MLEFNGTNPITDILGDQPTVRDVTIENQSRIMRIEPLTNAQLPPGETVLMRVTGDLAFSQIAANIEQINQLTGFEVIGMTAVIVPDDPEET
jgi:hypothetical protein